MRLTADERQKIDAAVGKIKSEDMIERLSAYLAQTGKRYKSHYATLLNWIRKDADNKPSKPEVKADAPRQYKKSIV